MQFLVSKHVLNAQVSIRAPCCRQWYDCAECHAEQQTHKLAKTLEMTFMCKKCRKAFRKDVSEYEESDEYCPHCDNHYVCFCNSIDSFSILSVVMRQVIPAKTPQAVLTVEANDVRQDSR